MREIRMLRIIPANMKVRRSNLEHYAHA